MKAGSRVSFQSWSTWLSKTHSSVMILFFPLWQVLWFLKKKKCPVNIPIIRASLISVNISFQSTLLCWKSFLSSSLNLLWSSNLSVFFFFFFSSNSMEELSIISCFLFTLYLKSMLFVSQFPSKNYLIQLSTIFLK